jgi:hypothetical protein
MGLHQTKGREAGATTVVLRRNDFYGTGRARFPRRIPAAVSRPYPRGTRRSCSYSATSPSAGRPPLAQLAASPHGRAAALSGGSNLGRPHRWGASEHLTLMCPGYPGAGILGSGHATGSAGAARSSYSIAVSMPRALAPSGGIATLWSGSALTARPARSDLACGNGGKVLDMCHRETLTVGVEKTNEVDERVLQFDQPVQFPGC